MANTQTHKFQLYGTSGCPWPKANVKSPVGAPALPPAPLPGPALSGRPFSRTPCPTLPGLLPPAHLPGPLPRLALSGHPFSVRTGSHFWNPTVRAGSRSRNPTVQAGSRSRNPTVRAGSRFRNPTVRAGSVASIKTWNRRQTDEQTPSVATLT